MIINFTVTRNDIDVSNLSQKTGFKIYLTFVALVYSVVVVKFNSKLSDRVKSLPNSLPGKPPDRKKITQILALM